MRTIELKCTPDHEGPSSHVQSPCPCEQQQMLRPRRVPHAPRCSSRGFQPAVHHLPTPMARVFFSPSHRITTWRGRGLRHLQGRLGARPGRALLHQRHLLGHPRALRLHEVRQARPRLRQLAVAPRRRRLRPAPLRPGPLPRPDEGQDHRLRRGLPRQEPQGLPHLPPHQSTYLRS